MSAELSQLLAELARTPEVDVDVAAGWTPDLSPGDVVAGRFELRRELGRGGFGVVFEALDRELGREVAFKAVLPGRRVNVRNQEWVQREAEAVACLNHPNIVTLHDFGRAPTGPYLIFELLRGETLAQRLKRGPLPLRDAVALASHVARVLDHAHRAGVVHRDLKPGNVFLCQHGAVKVLDFGLAHLFGRGGVLSGGTPSYMAPEQKRSEPGDARTDLFALGVVLHEMITGSVPARPDKEPEAAVEPGPVAQLPKDAAPAPLRRLVARMLDRDPAGRPASAREVLDVLGGVERRLDGTLSRRRSAAIGLVAAGALAVAAFVLERPLRPAEPFLVAVADFENGTGDREMDGLSGLLSTSLEQSRRLQVLPRWRLLSLLRELRLPESSRMEGPVARAVARAAGARVLLRGTARRIGETYALELEALDPAADRGMFSLVERAPAKAEVLGALDRLAGAVRHRLSDRAPGGGRLDVAVTASLRAYEAYWEGVDCVDRPSATGNWISTGKCAPLFREALARDPGFTLAHYQLAYLLQLDRRPREDVDTHLRAALRGVDRLPRREAALVRAWAAHVDGRDEDALAAYGAILRDFPDDRQALYLAGYVLYAARRWAEAVPYFQKTLEVDPGAEWPLDDLVTSLALLGRQGDLRALVERFERPPATPGRSHAAVHARVWLGDAPGAVEAARRAVEQGGGPAAGVDLAGALFVAGELAEAEAVLEDVHARQPLDGATVFALARALGAQGRMTEALDVLDRHARAGEQNDQGIVAYARAMLVAGTADPGELWREAARAQALAPGLAPDLAVVLALHGDLAHAEALAGGLASGTTAAEEYAAVATWRKGDGVAAGAKLAEIEARDPWPAGVPPPAYFLAEVSADLGDWRGTLAAVERFRTLWPRGLSPAWTWPRAGWLAALARERLGDAAGARAEADRLLASVRHADAGFRPAREIRTLRQRVDR